MTNATQRRVAEYRVWKRGHPQFPLTVHPSGQWSKKIRGHVYYFGKLEAPNEALQFWTEDREYLEAGLTPPGCNGSLTVGELASKHLADIDDRIASGSMAQASRKAYVVAEKLLSEAKLTRMPIGSIGPEHFTMMKSLLERSGRGLRTQKNLIISIKVIFNWGHEMGLYDREIRYGPRFVPPSLHAIEADREQNSACRFLDRELILAALAAAKPKMKVAILLGINCGFYPGDTIAITLDHLHLDSEIPYHDFRRAKNNRRRLAVLWPETVEAIWDYRDNYRKPVNPSEEYLILARTGYRYRAAGTITLISSFNTLLKSVGERPDGVSLGSLRHTYGTVVDLTPDQAMIDLTMGHTNKSLQKRVYSQFNLKELPRLRKVASVVRDWLYGKSDCAVDKPHQPC